MQIFVFLAKNWPRENTRSTKKRSPVSIVPSPDIDPSCEASLGTRSEPTRSADFPVCRIAGFQTCERQEFSRALRLPIPCRLEIGDTADWKVCATLVAAPPRGVLSRPILCQKNED